MKILMTGFTPNQCNILRKKNPLYSGASAVYYALVAAGHEVVNTYPAFEHLDEYDAVVCGLYASQSIAGGYSEPCALMLSKFRETNTPVTFFLDDWHLQLIASGLKTFRGDERQLRRHMKLLHNGDKYWNVLDANVLDIMSVYSELYKGEFANAPAKVLIPWFMWVTNFGPEDMLHWPKGVLQRYDPTNLFPKIQVAVPPHKERNWILSSRYDMSKQVTEMNASWPVIRYGCKKNGDNIVPNELDLLDAAYAPNWGIISHAYPPRAQGQWRNRFMFADWTGSILYTTGLECIDDNFKHTVQELEQFDDVELSMLAHEQAAAYRANCWSKESAVAVINNVVKNGGNL